MSKFIPQVISFENKNKAEDRTLIVSYDFPLYFLIEIKHPKTPQNALAYRILETVKEKFKEGGLSAFQNFEEALKEVNEILAKSTEEGNTGFIGNLSAIIALFDKDKIHISSIGNAACFLIREKNITEITREQEQSAHPLKTFSNILSGELFEDDKIIFGNQDFFEHIPLNTLRQTTINHSQKEAALNFLNLLRRERAKTASALFLKVKGETKEKISTPETLYIDENKTKKFLSKTKKIISKFSLKLNRQNSGFGKFSFLPKNSRYLFVVLALIIGVILAILIFNTVKNRDNTTNQNERKILMQAEDKKREGDEAQKQNHKPVAESLYQEAIKIAEPINSKESKDLIAKINVEIDKMNNISRKDAKEVLDLLFLKEPEVLQIYTTGKDIFFVDKKSNQLYQNKDSKAPLSHSAGKFIVGTFQPQENLIIIEQDKEGIFEYNIDEGKLNKAEIVFEGKWEGAKAIATYFTNLYLLNSDDGQIYKHEKTAAGYSKAISYVNKDKIDLKNAISISLDGYLYVLKNDGQILKLMAGRPVSDFSISSVPETDTKIKNPQKIVTSVDSTKLYILSDNKIIVLEKNGIYSKTYIINGIDVISDFTLNNKNKKIVLLSNNKVYEIGL